MSGPEMGVLQRIGENIPKTFRHPALVPVLLFTVLLAACVMPPAEEPPAPPVVPTPTESVEPEPAATPRLASVKSLPTVTNVRGGPGTGYPVVFWGDTGTALTVVGRNADGDWLRVELDDQAGWIYGPLTDIDPDVRMALPITEPIAESIEVPTPAPEAEPDPPVEAPAPPADP